MLVNSVFQLGDFYAGKINIKTESELDKIDTRRIARRIAETFDVGEVATPMAAVKSLPEFLRQVSLPVYRQRERISRQALDLLVPEGLAQKCGDYYVIVKKNPAVEREVSCFRVNFYAAISAALRAG